MAGEKKMSGPGGSIQVFPVVAGGLCQEEIDNLKKSHGELLLVTVKKDGQELHFWFKKPGSATMSNYLRLQMQDPYRAGQVVFNDCLVLGEKNAVDDVEIFMNILPALSGIVEKLETEVKKF